MNGKQGYFLLIYYYSEWEKGHNNEKASPQEVIKEAVDKFIDTQLFVEKDTTYDTSFYFVLNYKHVLTVNINEWETRLFFTYILL